MKRSSEQGVVLWIKTKERRMDLVQFFSEKYTQLESNAGGCMDGRKIVNCNRNMDVFAAWVALVAN